MPAPSNTLLIEGSFEELADELAHYIGEVLKRQNPDSGGLQEEVTPLLEQGKRDDVLKKLVTASAALNTAPEKGQTQSSSLHSKDLSDLVQRVHCCLQSPHPSCSTNI